MVYDAPKEKQTGTKLSWTHHEKTKLRSKPKPWGSLNLCFPLVNRVLLYKGHFREPGHFQSAPPTTPVRSKESVMLTTAKPGFGSGSKPLRKRGKGHPESPRAQLPNHLKRFKVPVLFLSSGILIMLFTTHLWSFSHIIQTQQLAKPKTNHSFWQPRQCKKNGACKSVTRNMLTSSMISMCFCDSFPAVPKE